MKFFGVLRLTVVISLGSAFLVLSTHLAQATSATWDPNPASNDWNTDANWTPAIFPNGGSDVATFGASSITSVSPATIITLGSIVLDPGASVYTFDIEASSTGFYFNDPGVVNNSGVTQYFYSRQIISFAGGGTAGNNVVYTNASSRNGQPYNQIGFVDSATAGSATFINDSADGGGGASALMIFDGKASAASSLIMMNGPQVAGVSGSSLLFRETTSAAKSTIMSKGGVGPGASGTTAIFSQHARGGNATIIARGGENGGAGAEISLADFSAGDRARIEVFGNAILNVAEHAHLPVTIGSLEGDGQVLLGNRALDVGASNRSTTFSGVIQGTGPFAKVGTGTLALNGVNTYTGDTTVNSGMLGGDGTITGQLFVGTGLGSGAFLAPAAGTAAVATFTIGQALTFESDGSYDSLLQGSGNQTSSDQVVARGVTIQNGAQFNLLTQVQGALSQGTVFTVISNIASNPISGTFANLADGATIPVNGVNLQADYEGGDGNDLTLTVVP